MAALGAPVTQTAAGGAVPVGVERAQPSPPASAACSSRSTSANFAKWCSSSSRSRPRLMVASRARFTCSPRTCATTSRRKSATSFRRSSARSHGKSWTISATCCRRRRSSRRRARTRPRPTSRLRTCSRVLRRRRTIAACSRSVVASTRRRRSWVARSALVRPPPTGREGRRDRRRATRKGWRALPATPRGLLASALGSWLATPRRLRASRRARPCSNGSRVERAREGLGNPTGPRLEVAHQPGDGAGHRAHAHAAAGEPWVDQGDGAPLRRELPDDEEPPQPALPGDRLRARRRNGAGADRSRGARPARARRDHGGPGCRGAQAMRFPPLVAHVRVGTPERSVPLWIPIVLVWLPALLLLAPFLLVTLLVVLAVAPRWSFLGVGRGLWVALCETRGLHLDIAEGRRRISISL